MLQGNELIACPGVTAADPPLSTGRKYEAMDLTCLQFVILSVGSSKSLNYFLCQNMFGIVPYLNIEAHIQDKSKNVFKKVQSRKINEVP